MRNLFTCECVAETAVRSLLVALFLRPSLRVISRMEAFLTFLVCFQNQNREVCVPQPPGEDTFNIVFLERAIRERFSDILTATESDCRLILQVCVNGLVHPPIHVSVVQV